VFGKKKSLNFILGYISVTQNHHNHLKVNGLFSEKVNGFGRRRMKR
jgi:hypothetical protein